MILPSVAPAIFTGFRVAIGVSWMSIVAAELILELERVTGWQEPESAAEGRYSDVG